MLPFFHKLFARTRKARTPNYVRLELEAFEPRDLPSAGGPLGHAFAGPGITHTPSGAHNTQELTASLTGATGTSGFAAYRANTTTGQNAFLLKVSGLTASTTYTVQVDGTTIGQVTTDTNGTGHVKLTNLTATIAAGSVVTVLDPTGATVLQGTLAAATGHSCS
jgi:hypothetical protein